jgi:hypothetical protein
MACPGRYCPNPWVASNSGRIDANATLAVGEGSTYRPQHLRVGLALLGFAVTAILFAYLELKNYAPMSRGSLLASGF